ncbi:MAG: hypothetical protein L3K17_00740 [Thermoplasmata archaeon]|nr:hypothetical protein [Thermoplasmata archaeon]
MADRAYHRPRWLVPVAIATVVGLTLSGFVAAGSLKVTKGPTEHEIGNYVAASNVGTWWSVVKLATTTLPSGPTAPSNTTAAPTVLPSNGTVSYGLNGGASGGAALLWIFQALVTAPLNTEIELELNYSLSGNTSRFTVYLETPSSAFSGTLDVRLYYSIAASALSGGTIQSVTELSAKCLTVGTCP